MKIYYLHHSGFAVVLKNVTLIFDPIMKIPEEILDENKQVIFFISHAHQDHYNREIFNYDRSGVDYVLSNDIHVRNPGANVIFTHPYEEFVIDNIKVQTFGSTDQGISLLLNTGNEIIFYAGDLNWWAWNPVHRPNIVPAVEERDYKNEIAKVKEALGGKTIDVAFVPVDSRLDLPNGTYLGALYFIETLHPKVLVPMHFWGHFEVIDQLRKQLPPGCTTKIAQFSKKNQIVDF